MVRKEFPAFQTPWQAGWDQFLINEFWNWTSEYINVLTGIELVTFSGIRASAQSSEWAMAHPRKRDAIGIFINLTDYKITLKDQPDKIRTHNHLDLSPEHYRYAMGLTLGRRIWSIVMKTLLVFMAIYMSRFKKWLFFCHLTSIQKFSSYKDVLCYTRSSS